MNGKLLDLHSLERVGDNIEYHAGPAAKDFLLFRLGFSFYIDREDVTGSGGGSSSSGSHSSHWFSGGCGHSGGGHSSIGLIGR